MVSTGDLLTEANSFDANFPRTMAVMRDLITHQEFKKVYQKSLEDAQQAQIDYDILMGGVLD